MIDSILTVIFWTLIGALALTFAWCCYWADKCREPDESIEFENNHVEIPGVPRSLGGPSLFDGDPSTYHRADASTMAEIDVYSMRAWQPGHFTGEVIDDA